MKMVVAWHDAAFTTADLLLTPDILDRILEKFKLQHKLKSTWTRSEALIYEKMIDLDDSSVGQKETDSSSKEDVDKQSKQILDEISGQRMKLKEMREGKTSEAEEKN